MGKTYKSFRYSNNLVWDAARRGRTSAPGKPDIAIGSPPEFKGEAGVWAPEEMLVAALNACMMLTFVSFARSQPSGIPSLSVSVGRVPPAIEPYPLLGRPVCVWLV